MSDDVVQDRHVSEYVTRIGESGVFGKSKRRLRLLEHLLQSHIHGADDELKAYSIGLDVFDKSDDFDPSTDSIVRVEMGRLRNAIALFEASDFADTAIVVDIPVGRYQPDITFRQLDPAPAEATPEPSGQAEAEGAPAPLAPVAVQSAAPRKRFGLVAGFLAGAVFAVALVGLVVWSGVFAPAPPDVKRPAIGVQFVEVAPPSVGAQDLRSILQRSLSKSKTVRVLGPIGTSGTQDINPAAGFLVVITTREARTTSYFELRLQDAQTGQLIWANARPFPIGGTVPQNVANSIARELRVRLFGASKEVLAQSDPDTLDAEALFVLSTWVPGAAQSGVAWEQERIALARKALALDPNFGAAHSVLADKLAYLANVYAPASTRDNFEAARFHADQAMARSPLDPDVVFNVAQAFWHSGRIAESKATMRRVTELDPGHDLARFLAQVVPYSCARAPDAVLAKAIAFDEALSADNPLRWLTLTWIGWLHAYRGEWDEALRAEEAAARIFQIPYTFMRRAMILQQMGRTEEAKAVIATQTAGWDKFDARHYITSAVPRQCAEAENPELYVGYYLDLLAALEDI